MANSLQWIIGYLVNLIFPHPESKKLLSGGHKFLPSGNPGSEVLYLLYIGWKGDSKP
jgi:hypothetical protein